MHIHWHYKKNEDDEDDTFIAIDYDEKFIIYEDLRNCLHIINKSNFTTITVEYIEEREVCSIVSDFAHLGEMDFFKFQNVFLGQLT